MAKTQTERAVVDLVINGQAAKTTLKEISLEVTRTRSELNKMREADNPEMYRAKLADMHKLVDAQRQMTARINDTSTAWGRFKREMATVATGVVGGNIMTFMLQSLVQLIPGTIDRTMKLKDAFADMEKATGLSSEGVKKLNKELKAIDTRTANKELRDIAIAGGQLGVANDQLVDFVQNVDKAVVALGDEFSGGVDQVAKEVGGIAKLFDETRAMAIGPAINNIGSALNELGAAGAATSPVVAEFTTRMGQLGNLAPSLAETLGLGAALQELGLTAEIAASGLTGLLLTASNRSELFAQQLGMPTKALEQLINTSPNEFLMRLAQSFEGIAPVQVAQRLKDLKVESQESIKVMSLLADQTDFVKQKQELAGKAMAEGTSLTEEFNKKNHQLARDLKELNEWFNSLLSSEALQNFLTSAIHNTVEFIKILPQVGQWLSKNSEYFYLLMAATVAYYGATIKATIATIANTTAELARKAAYELGFRWIIITEAATKAYALATAVLTGQITLQTAAVTVARGAWAALSAIMLANPIGLVVAGLTALAYAVKTYSDNTEQALRLEREKLRLHRELQLLTELQTHTLEKFTEQLQDYNQMSQAERADYVKNIAIARLDLETRLIRMKARQKEMEMLALEPSLWEKLWAVIKAGGNAALIPQGIVEQGVANLMSTRQEFEASVGGLEESLKRYDGILKQIERYEKTGVSGGSTLNTIDDPDKKKKTADKKKADAKRNAEELERMLEQSREQTLKNDDQAYAAQLMKLGEKYRKMYELAHGNKEKMAEITRLMYIELAQIDEKENARKFKAQEKEQQQVIKLAGKELASKKEVALAQVQSRVASGGISKEEGKLAELQVEQQFLQAEELLYSSHYDVLRSLAADNAEALALIEEASAQKLAEIEAAKTNNLAEQASASAQVRASDVANTREATERKNQYAQQEKEFRQHMIDSMTSILMADWDSTVEGYKEYWSKLSVLQKAALVAQKAWALAEIGINLARQITLITTAAAAMNSVLPGSGIAWEIKGILKAVGQAAAQTAAVVGIKVPTFADGGFTGSGEGPSGFVDDPTLFSMGKRKFIAGEAGREFVISNKALQQPIVADFARMMDVAQRSGNYAMLSGGGAGAINGSPGSSGMGMASGTGGGMSQDMGLAILKELQQNRAVMETYANRPISFDFLAHERKQDEVQGIREDTKL